jgi:protein TonB
MSNRYFTHLGSVFFLHLVVLFGSWQFLHTDLVAHNLKMGPSVLKLQVASQVLINKPKPLKKSVEPAPEVFPPVTAKAGPVTEKTQTASTLNEKVKADLRSQYKSELRSRIEENKYYPSLSRRLGQKGEVVVAFTLLEDGHIVNIRIDNPSRYESLNESALDAVKKVHTFKPIPKELGESRMDIKVPLKFFTI